MEWASIRDELRKHVIVTATALWQQNELRLAVGTSNGSGGRYLFAMLEVAVYCSVKSDQINDVVGWDKPERYWASPLLLEIGVPLSDTFYIYKDLLYNGGLLFEVLDVYAIWMTNFPAPKPSSWEEHMQKSFLTYLGYMKNEVDKVKKKKKRWSKGFQLVSVV